MKHDSLKECTRCSSDACYTQEVTKDINIEMCYGCGFQSNSVIKKGKLFRLLETSLVLGLILLMKSSPPRK